MIREMCETDWKRVAEIYEQGLSSGTATFNTECPSYEDWNNSHIKECRYVYEESGKVVGWIAISPTSSRCVYKGCVEASVYVDADYQQKGIGEKLMRKLIEEALLLCICLCSCIICLSVYLELCLCYRDRNIGRY